MHIWVAKVTLLVFIGSIVAIRAPHGKKRKQRHVVTTAGGKREIFLLALAWLGSVILPLLWAATPLLSFADYPLLPIAYGAGILVFSAGLYVFYRAHADLDTNWSLSLEVFEGHTLVTKGIYKQLRHPMYAAIFLQGIGQALLADNWIVGPFNFCAFLIVFTLRVGPEERMMSERFGSEYAQYMKSTKRLIPGIW